MFKSKEMEKKWERRIIAKEIKEKWCSYKRKWIFCKAVWDKEMVVKSSKRKRIVATTVNRKDSL